VAGQSCEGSHGISGAAPLSGWGEDESGVGSSPISSPLPLSFVKAVELGFHPSTPYSPNFLWISRACGF
jgi:hypothetical protein